MKTGEVGTGEQELGKQQRGDFFLCLVASPVHKDWTRVDRVAACP